MYDIISHLLISMLLLNMVKSSSKQLPVMITLSDLNSLFEKSEKRILKEIDKRGFATKHDVEKIVNDALHVQLAEFNISIIKPQLEKLYA